MVRTPPWASVALVISVVAMVVIAAVVPNAVSSVFWWVPAGCVAASWWQARRRTRAVAESSARRLDERDLSIRNVAAWWGQGVTLGLAAATALMLLIAARLDASSANALLQRSGGILLSFVILGGAVPTVVASWLMAGAELDDAEFDT